LCPTKVFAAFPSFAGKRQISTDGGDCPLWSKDGRNVYFRAPDGTVMSAEIKTGASIEAGIPTPLFRYPPTGVSYHTYAPAADGKRFLVIDGAANQETKNTTVQTMVVVNWTAELKP
jgi:hypothetical protein